LEKRLKDVGRDIATRQDTSGDKFVLVLEGQEVRDRGIAGELLLRWAERMRGSRSERQVGSLAGFQLFVADNFMQSPELVIKGATTYTAKITDTALGTIRSLEHTIQHLEEVSANLIQNIQDSRKRLMDLHVQADIPFEYAERLASLSRRQQDIADELDLNKNQTPAQLET